jgi:phospholipase C
MDRLDAAGISWHFYVGFPAPGGGGWGWAMCPTFAECLYGPQFKNVVVNTQFITDANNGDLPAVSIVTPGYKVSQHNSRSMLQGDNWIGRLLTAAMNGPDWESTAVFITYDDCGCFYDHVPPPPSLGIRIPMVIISPYAKPQHTDSKVASFASLLAMVEHTFGLTPLSTEDATAYDYSKSFDFSQQPLGPIRMTYHPIPKWELRYMEAHPGNPDDPT